MGVLHRHRRKLIAAALLIGGPLALHWTVLATTGFSPPKVVTPQEQVTEHDGVRFVGPAYTTVRGGVREAYLEGTPEQLGERHVRLLGDHMTADENALWGSFEHFVPISAARALIMDISRVRYRHIEDNIPEPRRRELAAAAQAFSPDPNASHMPTYQRVVFLHSVYDISLSFEHSPLIGCSAFALGPGATKDGHTLIGRAFDMEIGDVFDLDKVVDFVREDGRIPYASVGWPGLSGVLTGMNLDGVMVLVNGARAGEPRTTGLPVVFSLREVLQSAHDTDEATAILARQEVMVSHIVFVADAKGQFAVVERAPGHPAFIRRTFADPNRVAVTNHFEGDLKDDPKNIAVREHTTTLPRRARLDEMLATVGPASADVPSALAMLRDHQCAGGVACPLGDRRSIDALIATHGVIADTTDRVLWVSKGPHLSGQFVRFDLRATFAPGHDPTRDPPPETLPADPILADGRYAEGRKHAGGPMIGGDAK
jgi:isopenicillin-N N-acyltransferase-like protein